MLRTLVLTLVIAAGCSSPAPRAPRLAPPSLPSDAGALCLGEAHACVIDSHGRLLCAGRNLDGQLGDGSTTNRDLPVRPLGLDRVDRVACGAKHTCAIASGVLHCWGGNSHGELGVGDRETRTRPTRVHGIARVVDVSVGTASTCGVVADGSLACFGSHEEGRLGVDRAEDALVPLPVRGVREVVAVSLGSGHACALTKAREAYCWGEGRRGQLGSGRASSQSTPRRVANLSDVTVIAAGGDTTCALARGTLSCFGSSEHGELGSGAAGHDIGSATPVAVVNLESPVGVVVGAHHACARLRDGSVKCWGEGRLGQLGRGGFDSFPTPVRVLALASASAIAAGGVSSCAIRSGSRALACWGSNQDGAFGNGTIRPAGAASTAIADVDAIVTATPPDAPARTPVAATPPSSPAPAAHVALGDAHACACSSNGSIGCAGDPDDGRLGTGSTSGRSILRPVIQLDVVRDVGACGATTCAVRATGGIACWGRSDRNVGTTSAHATSTPLAADSVSDATRVDVGRGFMCFVRATGAVSCAGENGLGQLGDGGFSSRNSVADVPGIAGAVDVAAGRAFACVLLASGEVACWGDGSRGQLGRGSVESAATPVAVVGLRDAVAISANETDACALRRNGSVVCWGEIAREPTRPTRGPFPSLGMATPFAMRPTPIAALGPATQIALGRGFACSLASDGQVRCWGPAPIAASTNTTRHTLDTNSVDVTFEAASSLDPIQAIDASDNLACALHASGRLECWRAAREMGRDAALVSMATMPWVPSSIEGSLARP